MQAAQKYALQRERERILFTAVQAAQKMSLSCV